MATAKTPDAWGADYARERGNFDDLRGEVERIVERLLAEEGISVFRIESRTKSVDSFTDKIRRKNEKYADPIAEITDLAALRVIAYFPTDVQRIGDLIEEHFAVDADHSHRGDGEGDPDRFGYRSDHYVVTLSDERVGLHENRRFTGMRVEIQVRTVMQHAWAAVDHRFRYKKSDLPEALQRRLYRLSALLEVADEQFAAIKEAGDALEAEYAGEVERGDLSAGIDVLSLRAFLQATGIANRWAQLAVQTGFGMPLQVEPDARLPELAHALRRSDVGTLAELERFLNDARTWGEDYLRALAVRVPPPGIFAIPADVLSFLALREAPAEAIDELGFRGDIAAALHQLRGAGLS